jgi:hypothetical protein
MPSLHAAPSAGPSNWSDLSMSYKRADGSTYKQPELPPPPARSNIPSPSSYATSGAEHGKWSDLVRTSYKRPDGSTGYRFGLPTPPPRPSIQVPSPYATSNAGLLYYSDPKQSSKRADGSTYERILPPLTSLNNQSPSPYATSSARLAYRWNPKQSSKRVDGSTYERDLSLLTHPNTESPEKYGHVEGTCAGGGWAVAVPTETLSQEVDPVPIPTLSYHTRTPDMNSTNHHCKMGNSHYCTSQSHCRNCTDPDYASMPKWKISEVDRSCGACQSANHKCDGLLPICASCRRLGRYCSYKLGVMGRAETAVNDEKVASEEMASEEEIETMTIEQAVESEVEVDASKDQDGMDDITSDIVDLEVEDWCVVDATDIDGSVEGETAEKVTSRSYKFW